MRKFFSHRYSTNQLPRIDRLLKRYSKLSTSDMDKRISDMHALRMRLKLARSLILAMKPDLKDVVSLEHYPSMAGKTGTRKIEAYAQELSPGVSINDATAVHRDAEILRARNARLGIMNDELKRISEKYEDAISASMEELEALKAQLEDSTNDFPGLFSRSMPYATGALLGAGLGFMVDRVQTVLSRITFMATGALLSFTAVFLNMRRMMKRAIMSAGNYILSKDYEGEVKQLSKGFDSRHIAFAESIDETMRKSRKGLESLLDSLLSQVTDNERAKAERDLDLFNAKNS
jgi:F0F1-type ATP synthase assembly protein I